MENKEQQILSEITQMITSLREQLGILEEKVSQLSFIDEVDVADEAPIDLDLGEVLDYPSVVESEENIKVAEVQNEDFIERNEETLIQDEEPLMQMENIDASEEESAVESEDSDDDLPEVSRPVIIDAMAKKELWRTAIPGSPLRDIRGAISLHDRIIFINGLFDEDPMFFQEVLTRINSMSSLEEVVEYLREVRPDWDMESDEVYRFMMAVRRRIQ